MSAHVSAALTVLRVCRRDPLAYAQRGILVNEFRDPRWVSPAQRAQQIRAGGPPELPALLASLSATPVHSTVGLVHAPALHPQDARQTMSGFLEAVPKPARLSAPHHTSVRRRACPPGARGPLQQAHEQLLGSFLRSS